MSEPFRHPTHAGDYVLQSLLARGGLGDVYAAVHAPTGQPVAVKLLRTDLLQDPAGRARIAREIEVLGHLHHPHIVARHGHGEADGRPFLAMTQIDGHSLADTLNHLRGIAPATLNGDDLATGLQAELDDPLAGAALIARDHVQATIACLLPIAEALAHVHTTGHAHGDVKPANILLQRDGTAVLHDFDLAHRLDERDKGRALAGTPHWLAPEQLTGNPTDHRVDVFTLAVTWYELLTLARPFDGDTQDAVLQRIARAEPPDPRVFGLQLPEAVLAVLEHALQKRPADRYRTMRDFAADLRALRDGRPVAARRASPAQRSLRRARHQPLRAAFAAVLVLALPLLLVFGSNALPEVSPPAEVETHWQSIRTALAADPPDLPAAARACEAAANRLGEPSSAVQFWRGAIAQRRGDPAPAVRACFERARAAADCSPDLRVEIDRRLAELPR